jgi:hypothetical protein
VLLALLMVQWALWRDRGGVVLGERAGARLAGAAGQPGAYGALRLLLGQAQPTWSPGWRAAGEDAARVTSATLTLGLFLERQSRTGR